MSYQSQKVNIAMEIINNKKQVAATQTPCGCKRVKRELPNSSTALSTTAQKRSTLVLVPMLGGRLYATPTNYQAFERLTLLLVLLLSTYVFTKLLAR